MTTITQILKNNPTWQVKSDETGEVQGTITFSLINNELTLHVSSEKVFSDYHGWRFDQILNLLSPEIIYAVDKLISSDNELLGIIQLEVPSLEPYTYFINLKATKPEELTLTLTCECKKMQGHSLVLPEDKEKPLLKEQIIANLKEELKERKKPRKYTLTAVKSEND